MEDQTAQDKIAKGVAMADDAVVAPSVHDGESDEKVSPKPTSKAAEFLHLHEAKYGSYSSEDEKKLVRKIDWMLLPMLWISTNISAIDVSYAALDTSSNNFPPTNNEDVENYHLQCCALRYDQ